MSDETTEGLSESSARVVMWKTLLEHRGFQTLMEIAKEQIQQRQSIICLQPLKDSNAVYEQEFMKGEAAGIGMVLALPQTQLEMAELDHKRFIHKEETENGSDSNSTGSDTGTDDSPFG